MSTKQKALIKKLQKNYPPFNPLISEILELDVDPFNLESKYEIQNKFKDIATPKLEDNLRGLAILWTENGLKGAVRDNLESYLDCLGDELQEKVDLDEMVNILGVLVQVVASTKKETLPGTTQTEKLKVIKKQMLGDSVLNKRILETKDTKVNKKQKTKKKPGTRK